MVRQTFTIHVIVDQDPESSTPVPRRAIRAVIRERLEGENIPVNDGNVNVAAVIDEVEID